MRLKDTTTIGDVTEMEVATALIRRGRKVLRPISAGARYDLVIDNEDGTFVRVQCKTGRLREGRVEFRLYSVSGHRSTAVGYQGQIDAYGVYCPQNDANYLVPVTAISACGSLASLRVEPARNGQTWGVRHAAAFTI
ncbi:MAG TPA: group I intron-associated PD-(D/E)XK endonuclease [Candidatus Saccharimonadales bacterium]|nr:group I intron-associated PD-(D/E)XK endonuclease [Candidatus Saccharimonadales bacterium]